MKTDIPASRPGGELGQDGFVGTGALDPPYDPETLCRLFEHSNSLRQNVDAYATNIDAFGHRLEPAIELDAEDADARVAECIYLERVAAAGDASLEPTDEEVSARRKELESLSRLELARLESFFDSCSEGSFVDLRRQTRQDLEVVGNAYWEVLRNARGEIARLVYVPAYTVRLMPLDAVATEVRERVQVSPVSFEQTTIRRRLRRFVQVQDDAEVYFKSFGDSRVISKKTGAVFSGVEELRTADPEDEPATEMIHFRIHSPRSPYGIPRWIGTLLSVLGSRSAEEVNYSYFENKSVPPLALLVSGGRLSEASIPRIERYIEENLRGKDNFHKMLILEAESGGGVSDQARAKIELKPLTDAQQQDALFQNYDERNVDKVGAAFRVPRLLRGESRDFNRAVADAQLRFAEDQVFQPERDSFDHLLNRTVLADMGIRFWRFRSQTPITRDPERLATMVEKLVRVGVLTPEEGRVLAADIFNRPLRKLGDDWVRRPLTLTLAALQNSAIDIHETRNDTGLAEEAQRMIKLRDELLAEESRLSREALGSGEPEVVRVSDDEFDSWFEPTPVQ